MKDIQAANKKANQYKRVIEQLKADSAQNQTNLQNYNDQVMLDLDQKNADMIKRQDEWDMVEQKLKQEAKKNKKEQERTKDALEEAKKLHKQ